MKVCSLLDEGDYDRIGEVTFEAVPAWDLSAPALEFEFDERTQGAEEMVLDGLLAAHEEALGVADLLDHTTGVTHPKCLFVETKSFKKRRDEASGRVPPPCKGTM